MNNYRLIIIIFIAGLLFFLAGFGKHFIQDDWAHLLVASQNSPAKTITYFNLWQSNNPDRQHFYRPLSTKLYYFLMYQVFGLQRSWYLLFNSFFFILNAYLIYLILSKLFNPNIADNAILFYLYSIVHFTSFSYIAIVEVLIFSFFSLLSIYFWIRHQNYLSLILFGVTLTTRETALILPLIFLIISIFQEKKHLKPKKGLIPNLILNIMPFGLISLFYAASRSIWYGWPADQSVYQTSVGFHIFTNLFKYLQWNLNLTGIIEANSPLSYVCLAVFLILGLMLFFAFRQLIQNKANFSILFFGLSWWLILLLPVLFFQNHIDSWNLILPSVGFSVCLAVMVNLLNSKHQLIFKGLYILVFLLGLYFYRQNHWTSKRSLLISKTYPQVTAQCSKKSLTMPMPTDIEDQKELQYAWFYDAGVKLVCQKTNLEVTYP